MRACSAFLVVGLLSATPALAEPIALGFDDLSYYGRSDDLPIEHYPGVFFVSLESVKDLGGNGFLATESGLQASIWQTLSGYRPYYDSPDYPKWVGRRFDFVGMEVRSRFPGGGSHGLTILGFRNYELVGSVTAEFGETFTWHAFDLKNVDLLLLLEPGQESHPFRDGGFAFDDFTYSEVPEPGPIMALWLLVLALGLGCSRHAGLGVSPAARDLDWPDYGGDPGGQRYSPADQIDRSNVASLEVAWIYRTGDSSDGKGVFRSKSSFEATPLLVDRTLYLCTPMNRVIALDPVRGTLRWSYDPKIDPDARYANDLVCRGVATWLDPSSPAGSACARRIFSATNDARLIALDSRTGRPCPDFGVEGIVDLNPGVGAQEHRGEYQVTSPPLVAGDRVVVGSAVTDNDRITVPSGVVRAFDARSGELRWAWDAAPAGPLPAGRAEGTGYALGSPNAWAPLAFDRARDLVFVPTGNPSPDYFGGLRRSVEAFGSSLVALRGSTGEVVWHFQTVHHDLWDYDVASQPTLLDIQRDGAAIPAVVQATKMGLLFVLNRETGEPLFPIEERPVAQTDVPGEATSPTQPFPLRPPPLVSHALPEDAAWGLTPLDRRSCRARLARLRNEGIYTPPSLGAGSLMYPGNAGGSSWGGIALDPHSEIAIANVNQIGFVVSLLPAQEFERARSAGAGANVEYAAQRGTPYAVRRAPFLSSIGVPCSPPPWGKLVAVDLREGKILWEVKLGSLRDMLPVPLRFTIGTPNLGGPLVTASGLVFIAAALDDDLRAFDLRTGDELWRGRLPAGGQATPMTYVIDGWQYVVIAAGGHGRSGTRLGDAVVAFRLPRN